MRRARWTASSRRCGPVIRPVEDRFGNGLAVTRSFVVVAGLLVGGTDWSGVGLVGVWDR